ncbi:hypothetical protein Slala03_82240 [Streptomyces lavendulae subsp. lavendulae]|uniref:GNAT family N-acetyltransferase n=1 Tax=Streptomyces lavendulae TaxID=1914 RepID=UPI0024A3D515|nr:GNAT family N-acetyltransferase [Streptomyces lavendulae]GLV88535.1 hypothetical protein Slala03_82240 [Streptomyces lavendulae subsp. lavendulae]
MSDMKVTVGGPDEVRGFVSMLHDYSSWLILHRFPELDHILEWENPGPVVRQVQRHARAGEMRICWDLLDRVTGGSVLTDEAPEFAPPAGEPELYLHFLVTGLRFRKLSMAALVADARAEAARRGARLLRTHCWTGEDRRFVHEYEELGFTATVEFEELRSDGSVWPGQVLQTRV